MVREKTSIISTIFLAMVAVLVITAAVYGAATQTLYVSPTGTDSPDCGTSGNPCKTINYTLQKATPNTTIQLAAGTYAENVLIDVDKDLITLSGSSMADCFIAAPSTNIGAVEIHRVRAAVQNLTITGGPAGIYAESAMVKVRNCTIPSGIGADASNLDISSVTIKSPTGNGISGSNHSMVGVSDSNLSGSYGSAVNVWGNSALWLENCVITSNNKGLNGALGAICVDGNSSASLQGNTISSNNASGIAVQGCSSVQLMGGNKVNHNGLAASLQSNFRSGISIAFNSFASLNAWPPGGAVDQVIANGGPGIFMTSKANLMIMSGKVSGNSGDGITLNGDSTANFTSGAVITANLGWGVACNDRANDSKYMGYPGTITGNTLGAIKGQQY